MALALAEPGALQLASTWRSVSSPTVLLLLPFIAVRKFEVEWDPIEFDHPCHADLFALRCLLRTWEGAVGRGQCRRSEVYIVLF